jgi:hypothetical protein
MKKSLSGIVSVLLAVLTLVSWFLVYRAAFWEPFTFYRVSDVLWQVGGAFVVITLLLELVALIFFGIATNRLSGWWAVSLIWLALLFLLSIASAAKWTSDQSYFQESILSRQKSRPAP